MTNEKAESLLSDENITHTAMVLSALDFEQAKESRGMEAALKEFGKYSESDTVSAANKAIKGLGWMSIPGNGQGIKMNLSVFLNGLRIIGKEREMEIALNACGDLENLDAQ